jgi:hypothetical protein
MPNETGIIADTLTGLECSSYSPILANCQWGGRPSVEFPTLTNAINAAQDMSNQAGTPDRFIGKNPPKPR